ncbi:MlaD family protein [Nocardia vaccinii]|uniref:MlaD family protein n=1 Tax=Nocardia vaccinii TaxID=1822 RepID=UPI00082F1DC6|nr:MlaD family protein [Nocardia vaccinii]
MRNLVASRGFLSIVVAAIIAALAASFYVITTDPLQKKLSYCALMPDSIGLYIGNHVTVRGIPVGAVTGIRPEGTGVRVDFDIAPSFPLYGDVTATTVSDTIVADRDLAVLGEPTAQNKWQSNTCITKTFTPKSLTESLSAFSKLAGELGGDGSPGNDEIRKGVAAIDAATSGTGPRLNELINQLGAVLHSPDAAIGHIGDLIDAMASITKAMAYNWEDIKVAIVNAEPGIDMINTVWNTVSEIMDSLVLVFPWFNSITLEYGRPIFNFLDAVGPSFNQIAAQVGTLQQLVDMIPPIVDAFERVTDPATGQIRLTYAQPKVALSQPLADMICARANAETPSHCHTTDSGLAHVDLVPLILGMAGAR